MGNAEGPFNGTLPRPPHNPGTALSGLWYHWISGTHWQSHASHLHLQSGYQLPMRPLGLGSPTHLTFPTFLGLVWSTLCAIGVGALGQGTTAESSNRVGSGLARTATEAVGGHSQLTSMGLPYKLVALIFCSVDRISPSDFGLSVCLSKNWSRLMNYLRNGQNYRPANSLNSTIT